MKRNILSLLGLLLFVSTQAQVPGGFKTIIDTSCIGRNVQLQSPGGLQADWFASNATGTIGTGSSLSVNIPDNVSYVAKFPEYNWSIISAAWFNGFAIRANGSLWAWGSNLYGQLGQGSTTPTVYARPVQIGSDTNWKTVACGYMFAIAIKKDGTLWSCGMNSYGQLGDNSTIEKYTFNKIGSDTDWVDISCGYQHVVARKSNGTIWTWGSNAQNQLGDSTFTSPRTYPSRIGSASNWSLVRCGQYHTMGIRSNGSLWGWGSNSNGAIGDSTIITKKYPVRVGTDSSWLDITCGYTFSIGLKKDSSMWSWGYNVYGMLGDSSLINKIAPTRIAAFSKWIAISANYYDAAAIDLNHKLWAWGRNSNGEVGDSSLTMRKYPVPVYGNQIWNSIAISYYKSYGINANNSLYAWGDNSSNYLGVDSITTSRIIPIQMNTYATFKFTVQKFVPAFDIIKPIQCVNNNQFVFQDRSTVNFGQFTRNWMLGNSTNSSSASVITSYASAGTKVIGLKITGNWGCTDSTYHTIRLNPKPMAGFNVNKTKQCFNSNQFIFTNTSPNAVYLNAHWNFGNGDTSSMNSPAYVYQQGGVYPIQLIVSDTNNCYDTSYSSVYVSFPTYQPLCMVTVDSSTQKNTILWERVNKSSQTHYKIYKESNVAGIYAPIGTVSADSAGRFKDVNSNPAIKSERYKMAAIDTCTTESLLSEPHKTMHLSANVGTNNSINLQWESYEGKSSNSIYIFRGSSPSTMQLLTMVQSSINSYSDLNPPSGSLYYVLAIDFGSVCDPYALHKSGSSFTYSNRVQRSASGIMEQSGEPMVHVFPNPANDMLTIHVAHGNAIESLEWIQMNGQKVLQAIPFTTTGKGEYTLQTSSLAPGMYRLWIQTRVGVSVQAISIIR